MKIQIQKIGMVLQSLVLGGVELEMLAEISRQGSSGCMKGFAFNTGPKPLLTAHLFHKDTFMAFIKVDIISPHVIFFPLG